MKKFQVIVIGSGPAGSGIAHKCAKEGKKVAVIDKEFGGTCALKGCTPKKVLAVSSEILRYACHLNGKGVKDVNVELDWGSLMHFKRSFTELTPMHTKEGFKKAGIEVIEGAAQFVNNNTLEVNGEQYEAEHIAIATGAVAAELPIEGYEHLITSDELLELDKVPKRVAFVGGGYIAFEFAQILKKCGCEVTLLEAADQPLSGFDPFLASRLIESFQMDNLEVRTGIQVEKIEKQEDEFVISGKHSAGELEVRCDLAIHGAGRMPNIAQLHLENADIAFSKKGITVNDHLQSVSNSMIYAAGDVADTGYPFTLVADYEGRIVANNIFDADKQKSSYMGVPFVLFTNPKMASVGKSEEELIANKVKYEKKQADTSHWLIARSLQENVSGYKVLIGEKGKILGAHLVGPKADEVINGFAMAMQHNLSVNDLKKTFLSYPSAFAEIRKMI
ncbi:dihydrolipoyl dehydrogenase family protein [Fulvivirga sediminis]|uniref:NAD(P)/FAD-dependent oxidoreductase n=1 Tax=Fulvivirga sediminis TaxID=2803949 RepID=A0A937F350_9BACT|nr:NAD(P)/FAD-dependent oxidoreductase [Fulvivirga sediminis]MBL3655457.1 NAD(P)/FAD-dependent oxidoreductase [Fulvivirga sediminis]